RDCLVTRRGIRVAVGRNRRVGADLKRLHYLKEATPGKFQVRPRRIQKPIEGKREREECRLKGSVGLVVRVFWADAKLVRGGIVRCVVGMKRRRSLKDHEGFQNLVDEIQVR